MAKIIPITVVQSKIESKNLRNNKYTAKSTIDDNIPKTIAFQLSLIYPTKFEAKLLMKTETEPLILVISNDVIFYTQVIYPSI